MGDDSAVADYAPRLPEAWVRRLTEFPPAARLWADEVLALAETVAGKDLPLAFDSSSPAATTSDYLAMLDDRLVVAHDADGDEQLAAWLDAEPDRVFREITEEALDLMIAASGGSIEAEDEWWFHRAPQRGYVREALLRDGEETR